MTMMIKVLMDFLIFMWVSDALKFKAEVIMLYTASVYGLCSNPTMSISFHLVNSI